MLSRKTRKLKEQSSRKARNPELMTVKIRKLVAKAMAQKLALWIKVG